MKSLCSILVDAVIFFYNFYVYMYKVTFDFTLHKLYIQKEEQAMKWGNIAYLMSCFSMQLDIYVNNVTPSLLCQNACMQHIINDRFNL